jgi:hypothetical protein
MHTRRCPKQLGYGLQCGLFALISLLLLTSTFLPAYAAPQNPHSFDINPGMGSSPWSDDYAIIGNIFYFVASDGTHSSELWRSDGTAASNVVQ